MIILEALQVADKVLDIRKKAEEVRGMKLANDKIARELDKEAENEKKLGIDAITNKVTKELKIKPDGDGDKIPALDKAIKNLVEFIEQGGEVDCVIPESAEASSDSQDAEAQREKIKQLRTSFEEIRLLEDKLRQIEHKED